MVYLTHCVWSCINLGVAALGVGVMPSVTHLLFITVLCCAMLCYAVLCCAALCYVVLCLNVLCCIKLQVAMLTAGFACGVFYRTVSSRSRKFSASMGRFHKVHTHAHSDTHIHTNTHTHAHIHTNTHTHAHIDTRRYTYAHRRSRTRTQAPIRFILLLADIVCYVSYVLCVCVAAICFDDCI